MKRGTVLLVDDCPKEQQTVADSLSAKGYSVTTISDPRLASKTVESWAEQYNFVIIQEVIQGRMGLELLSQARSRHKNLPVLVVTRDADWSGYARALSEGAVDYLPTPLDQGRLLRSVEQALVERG